MSDSIESFSGTHASPLRERCSSPSLPAGVWLDMGAFVSPSSNAFCSRAQEFSSVIARMRCSKRELSWGKVDFVSGADGVPVIISYFILILLSGRRGGSMHRALVRLPARLAFQT